MCCPLHALRHVRMYCSPSRRPDLHYSFTPLLERVDFSDVHRYSCKKLSNPHYSVLGNSPWKKLCGCGNFLGRNLFVLAVEVPRSDTVMMTAPFAINCSRAGAWNVYSEAPVVVMKSTR